MDFHGESFDQLSNVPQIDSRLNIIPSPHKNTLVHPPSVNHVGGPRLVGVMYEFICITSMFRALSHRLVAIMDAVDIVSTRSFFSPSSPF